MKMGLVLEEGLNERFNNSIKNKDYFILIAMVDEIIVGYCLAQDFGFHLRTGKKTCRLHDLFVDSAFREKGIAKKIMEHVYTWCRKRNTSWLQWNSSKDAIQFYKKIGCEMLDFDKDHPEFEMEFQYEERKRSKED
ncbi:GNAT family N-acetyltransferase [Bacillus sp. Bva_UNVM-123]|uniref:N-acetyltransferase family protein n=1 Tax=Bacillus sp. Bva_UNVM-123 TaxID=2829798 RepID=UPI00391F1071